MAAKPKTTPKNPTILDVWGKTDDAKKSENLQLNFKMLQAKGNEDLIHKQIKVNESAVALEAAKQGALKKADFTVIAKASLVLEASQLEFSRAKQVFIDLFGIEPSV